MMKSKDVGLKKYQISLKPSGRGRKSRIFNVVGVNTFLRPVAMMQEEVETYTDAMFGVAADDGTCVFECPYRTVEYAMVIEHMNDLAPVRDLDEQRKPGRTNKRRGTSDSPDGIGA